MWKWWRQRGERGLFRDTDGKEVGVGGERKKTRQRVYLHQMTMKLILCSTSDIALRI